MTTFRIKLVETTTTEGTVEFPIVAASAAAAAAIVSDAYDIAREHSLNVLSLPDGQSSTIEPCDTVERTTKMVLVDEAGTDLRIITPEEATNGPH